MLDEPPTSASLRSLPAVGKLLTHPRLQAIRLPAELVTEELRREIAIEREARLAGQPSRDAEQIVEAVQARLQALQRASLRRVVNATGVVLNTNLGRAPLAPAALDAITELAGGYSNLEIDLASGQRGSRYSHVEALLCRLTGAESALVVNNCAAAVLLAVDTLARDREVIVSRGQLIEIGGSFRLPEVIAASGARLKEVGTTNKTYLKDYARAIGPDTGLLMLSHTSNYRIIGFTAEVSREDLAALGRENGVPTMEDLGSGLLVDLTAYGLPFEPTVQASVAAGLDLVAVSGDKLMGGSQCGILVGRKAIVDRLKQNPLLRALRQDKLAIAALEATLKLYLQPEKLPDTLPLFAMLAKPAAVLKREAEALAQRLSRLSGLDVRVQPGRSSVGGGTLPGVEVDTILVALRSALSADELARRLRTGEPAVVARIVDDALVLDPRTLLPGDAQRVAQALESAL